MLEICILLVLLAFAFYKWATQNHDFFEKRNVKYLKPTFLLGSTGRAFFNKYSATEFSQLLYQAFPDDSIYGLFDFRVPQYVVRDPETIKLITVKDFDHFEDHKTFTDEKTDRLFGNALIFLKGEKWRQMRATLSPAFTGSKMRQMFELIAECTDGVVEHYTKQAERGSKINVEMKDFCTRYANDVIASCAFGLKVNSFAEPDNEFYTNGKNLLNFSALKQLLKMLLMFQLPAVARILKISITGGPIGKTFYDTILNTMKYRKEKGIFRPDMINIMMQVRDGTLKHKTEENKKEQEGFATVEESDMGKLSINRSWNDDEIVAQCFLFFVAGFDTTSTLLTFAAYELAANPDVQQKLYEEIANVNEQLDGKRINYDALQKMEFLDQVISETLRKWPPVPQVDRLCNKDYVLKVNDKTLKLEKGTPLLIPVYSIHHDAKYFPNPELFDPERFNDDSKRSIAPFTFNPFGYGPRNCIGSRFALMEIKAILYNLMLKFSIEPNEKTVIPVKLAKSAFSMQAENGMHVQFKLRK